MSTRFKYIEKVYFDDVESKVGNAYIYNMSFTQGYSASPAKLTISAVSEDGDYSSVPAPNFSDIYVVKIGEEIIFRGFIITKKLKITENERIAVVTLVDKSIRLDQYGIGLINRHARDPEGLKSVSYMAQGVNKLGMEVGSPRSVTFQREQADGVIQSGKLFAIGREQLASSICEIPDVQYFQRHFNKAIDLFKGETGISFDSLPTIISGRNYTGTIREVLNSLCSDQGSSFYYNSKEDKIFLYKLDGNKINWNLISQLKNDDNIVITDYDEVQSLENTYSNFCSVREMRPGKSLGGDSSCTVPVANPVDLSWLTFTAVTDFHSRNCGLLNMISPELRAMYCRANHLWSRIGITSRRSLLNLIAVDLDCVDLNNTPCTSNCRIERAACDLGMPVEELRQIFLTNPSLQGGCRVFAANVSSGPSVQNWWVVKENELINSLVPLYRSIYSPSDIQMMNITGQVGDGGGGVSRPFSLNLCTLYDTVQSPEPKWVDMPYLDRGWYFSGGDSFSWSNTDLSDYLSYYNLVSVNITADMVQWGISSLQYYEVLIFEPLPASYSSHYYGLECSTSSDDRGIQIFRESVYNVPEIPTINGGTPNPGDDCVPFDIVVQPGFTKGNLGCQGSCEDQTLQEAFYDLEVCGKDLPPGEICERYRMGISMVLKDGSSTIPFSVYLPARSDHFRSNLTTQYKTNKTHGRSIRIDTISAGGNDGLYAKLNINDIDATSSIFEPSAQTTHYVIPEESDVSFEDITSSASKVFGDFIGVQESVSVSIFGVPTNIGNFLDPKITSSWNIGFGNRGIAMNLEFSDAPPQAPSMDYLQSRLHNQFHYNTLG